MISLMVLGVAVASSPDLGKAEGRCRPNEDGAAFMISVTGLKDRKGNLKLELYPSNDKDFLADDNDLINAGKAFARVEMAVPATGPVNLCIRAPRAGRYSLLMMHDRDANRKMGLSIDGIAFPGNRKLCWRQPKSGEAAANVGPGPTPMNLVMNYRQGIACFGPLKK